ncbi:Serine/threonine-protein kinase HipA [Pseudovibrio axinellae]|uniref:Serine/threonine-protein kinase HipA n=1 Tax=Pseudovibrio axinellae TaxID=989403 RepID=A0A165VRJ2_9HYPH|nr:type II toxin-antitoxin system HipA family toxin [Pseudovibrio axinellae]KZL15332.1 Serine/threonine-protein kinase HipA [Pseudovibrio axinellae]SER83671.1 serine/threonine-protein kinase HipA [Pseudovibrio axinellae]
MSRILDVYLHESLAGTLEQSPEGTLHFTYDLNYLQGTGPAISVSMQLREQRYDDPIARPFFSGLLPDERARRRLAAALGVSERNAFGLLEIIGGECAGALSLVPQGQSLPEFLIEETEALSPQQLAEVLHILRDRPLLGGEQGVRLSLAGAQDKLAVAVQDNQITLPRDGRPTTHILKPFIEGLDGTVENELFCMTLARRLGFNVPKVSKGVAGDTPYILIERYDRLHQPDGTIRKLHQEDFCQALSVAPELKYEQEGGPGVEQAHSLIQAQTRQPAADRLTFQRMLIYHYLVGNADAHAKNYALLYNEETPDLAPLYDVICTTAYPRLAKKMAMKIGGRDKADTLLLKNWQSLVPQTKGAQRLLSTELNKLASKIGPAAQALIDELAQEGITHAVLPRVHKIVRTRSRLLQEQTKNGAGTLI